MQTSIFCPGVSKKEVVALSAVAGDAFDHDKTWVNLIGNAQATAHKILQERIQVSWIHVFIHPKSYRS